MKNCIAIATLATLGLLSSAHATLGPGSIAFTGFNADGNDNLAFVALETLPAGTVIGFTDNEWNGTSWNTGENGFSLTLTTDVAPGTIVAMNNLGGSTFAGTSPFGSMAAIPGAGTNPGISNSDESVWAFIGDYASPTAFLSVIGNDALSIVATTLDNTGLKEGETALFITGDEDVMAYNGLRDNLDSFPGYLTQIYDAKNWITEDGSGDQSNNTKDPNVPFSNDPFTIPAPGAAGLIALAGMTLARRRR